jgi:hypothetical protein
MPTIELVALECSVVPEMPSFGSFAVISETVLESHRGLFQPEFDRVSGIMVHLASKSCESDPEGFWFAGDLIDWDDGGIVIPTYESGDELNDEDKWHGEDQLDKFRFESSVLNDLRALIGILLESSSVGEVWFTTDIQFGPSIKTQMTVTLSEFFDQLVSSELRWHCLYRIRESWAGCHAFPLTRHD